MTTTAQLALTRYWSGLDKLHAELDNERPGSVRAKELEAQLARMVAHPPTATGDDSGNQAHSQNPTGTQPSAEENHHG